ncbi:hypothetical protein [Streptomyces sp. NBC_01262]|jgi:hypothetical protein|uniref:hypothetical protein n=1 Tax=Streptomyces sp. NBC_01262 TaxID=2903803 RepID=UPI002E320C39|nr:hypothetical protein [Streptomyces sp. NBC_01262]
MLRHLRIRFLRLLFLLPLLVLYALAVVPAGLVARLLHDPLHRRPDRRATSYWTLA